MIISGAYSNDMGGRIYLNPAENLERQTMAGTYFHESGHAWLDGSTVLGVLRNVLQMEAIAAEELDGKHSDRYRLCARMLTSRTEFVQEVFANNLELLMLEQQSGEEEMLRALRDRPGEYQGYYMELWPVNHSGQPVGRRIEQVIALCTYAMNVPLPPRAEVEPEALAAWLKGDADPTRRLKRAVRVYQEQGVLPEQRLDEKALWRFAEEAVVYIKPYLQEGAAYFDRVTEKLRQGAAPDALNRRMMKMVRLFDPAMLRPLRLRRLPEREKSVLLVMKGVRNLRAKEHFYLIGYDDGRERHISAETGPGGLDGILAPCLSACVLWPEYDQERGAPADFCVGARPLTVLLQTNEECGQWLGRELELGTVYVGELAAHCAQTDVSVLFFCRRGAPRRIFVFPTLYPIGHALLKEFGLEGACCAAAGPEFVKLFSCFDNEVEQLRYLQELLALLLGRSWKQMLEHAPLCQMAGSVGTALGNSILQIRRPDHYRILAALPQKETEGEPLFTLMRFEQGRNTGDIYLDEGTKAPLLFSSRREAERFTARYAPEYTGVGIDRIFWPVFRSIVKEWRGKAAFVLDVDTLAGKLVDVEAISAAWYG